MNAEDFCQYLNEFDRDPNRELKISNFKVKIYEELLLDIANTFGEHPTSDLIRRMIKVIRDKNWDDVIV